MKKTLFMFVVFMMTIILSSCGDFTEKADYDSPKEVIKAHENINPEWENNRMYDDLKGKTFKVKTTQKLDKSDPKGNVEEAMANKDKGGRDWMCVPYSSIDTDVMLWLTTEQWENIKYNEGDTLLLQVEFIAQRGSKSGNIRQYYINAVLPD
ncbi:MAG: hypothetical protein IJ736_07570 [Firmicutes bacterium]|nr:hypothetical protein [Bacillota bacterium]